MLDKVRGLTREQSLRRQHGKPLPLPDDDHKSIRDQTERRIKKYAEKAAAEKTKSFPQPLFCVPGQWKSAPAPARGSLAGGSRLPIEPNSGEASPTGADAPAKCLNFGEAAIHRRTAPKIKTSVKCYAALRRFSTYFLLSSILSGFSCDSSLRKGLTQICDQIIRILDTCRDAQQIIRQAVGFADFNRNVGMCLGSRVGDQTLDPRPGFRRK